MRKLLSLLLSLYHRCLPLVGAVVYRFPSRHIRVIGVTGTKGKSTTLALLFHIFEHAGYTPALVSSTSVWIGKERERNTTGNSMPGRFFLQRFLRKAYDKGCDIALIEVTSQGVAQFRHYGIDWNDVAFLGIHPEHIEAHGSFEAYRKAKESFFSYAAAHTHATCFVYADDPHAASFVRAAGNLEVVFFSQSDGLRAPTSLDGAFNQINIACARRIASREGVDEETIKEAVLSFKGLEGRMQVVCEHPVKGVVDYAHTPDSLRAVLSHLASQTDGALICVLGSAGGGRDTWKRPHLGAVASEYCDRIIVTNEDPYDEDPRAIMEDIYKGISDKHKEANTAEIIEDREGAIVRARSYAKRGDCIVCSGKGSEQSIHSAGGKIIPWSDAEVLGRVCRETN